MVFDHLVIVVPNLEIAAQKFEVAGFTVSPGGKHFAGISENKLIFFEDNTFIELLSIRNSIGGLTLKFLYYTKLHYLMSRFKKLGLPYRFYFKALERRVGLYDFCFLAKDLKSEENRLEKSNIKMSAIISAGRVRPDGNILKWDMSTPISSHLPFLRDHFKVAQDAPKANHPAHRNGVIGIKTIECKVTNLVEKIPEILSFYGEEKCDVSNSCVIVKTPNTELKYSRHDHESSKSKSLQYQHQVDFILDFNFSANTSRVDFNEISEYLKLQIKNK